MYVFQNVRKAPVKNYTEDSEEEAEEPVMKSKKRKNADDDDFSPEPKVEIFTFCRN